MLIFCFINYLTSFFNFTSLITYSLVGWRLEPTFTNTHKNNECVYKIDVTKFRKVYCMRRTFVSTSTAVDSKHLARLLPVILLVFVFSFNKSVLLFYFQDPYWTSPVIRVVRISPECSEIDCCWHFSITRNFPRIVCSLRVCRRSESAIPLPLIIYFICPSNALPSMNAR